MPGILTDLDHQAIQQALQETFGGALPASNSGAPLGDSAPEILTEAQLQKEKEDYDRYTGPLQKLRTFAESAASTATLGGSTLAQTKLFGTDPEDIQKRRELNPTASTAGDLTGILTPALLTGGASAAAQTFGEGAMATKALSAAAKASQFLPAELAINSGKAATGLIAKGLEDVGSKTAANLILKSTLAHAAGGIAEGVGFGAGQSVDEYALGDPDLNAEKVLSNIGTNALFMGGLGAFKGLVKGAGPSLVDRGQAAIAKLKDAVGEGGLKEAAAEGFAKASSLFSHENPELVKEAVLNPEASLLTKSGKEALNRDVIESTTDLTNSMQEVEKAKIQAHYMMNDELAKETEGAFDARSEVKVANHLDDLEKQLDAMNKSSKYTDKVRIEEALDTVRDAKAKLKPNATGLAEAFKILDNVKRELADQAGFSEDLAEADRGVKNTTSKLGSMYHDTARALEDAEAFGPVGANQSAWAAESRGSIGDLQEFQKKFMRKIKDASGRTAFEIDSRKVYRYINNIESSRNITMDQIFNKGLDAMKKSFDQVNAMAGGPEQVAYFIDTHPVLSKISEFQNLSSELSGKLKTEQLAFKMKELEHGISGHALGVGDVLAMGGLLHALGPIGPMAYGAFNYLKHPMNLVRNLASLQKMTERVSKNIGGSIDSFLGVGSAIKKNEKYAVPLVYKGLLAGENKKDKNSSSTPYGSSKVQESYHQEVQKYNELVTNPQKMQEMVEKVISPIAKVAPQMANSMAMKLSNNANAIYQRAPKAPETPTLFGFQKPFRPSDVEIAKWARFKQAVDHPETVLDDMKAGRLTKDAVDGLKVGSPKLYEEIQKQILEKTSDIKNPLPYGQKIQLSILFNVPADSTLRPDFVQSMQKTFSQETPLPQPSGGGQNLNLHSASELTPVQKIESR